MENLVDVSTITFEEFCQLEKENNTQVVVITDPLDPETFIKSGYWYIHDTTTSLDHLKAFDKHFLFVIPSVEEGFVKTIENAGFNQFSCFVQKDEIFATDDMILSIDAYEFQLDTKHESDATIIDLRTEEECKEGYVKGALNIQIKDLADKIPLLEDTVSIYIYCDNGERSLIASSILKQHQIHHFKNIVDGFNSFGEYEINIVKPKKKK